MSLLQNALDRLDVVLDLCDGEGKERTMRAYLNAMRGDLMALSQLRELTLTRDTREECVRRHLSLIK